MMFHFFEYREGMARYMGRWWLKEALQVADCHCLLVSTKVKLALVALSATRWAERMEGQP